MSPFWKFVWGASKVILGFGIFFLLCYLVAVICERISTWTMRHERKLKSFTLFFPGIMTVDKLKTLLNNVNLGIDTHEVDLKDVVSISALPSDDGNQFTIWYKDKPPKAPKTWGWNHGNNYYQDKRHKGLY